MQRDRPVEQCPDRIADRGAVGVDLQVVGLVVVAGDVDVCDALARQRPQECVRVVAVVGGVDVDVVDVEQQLAIGLGQHGVDEVDLAIAWNGAA